MTTTSTHQIWMYDTTLRDGTQREGLSLSIEDKLRIAYKLDQLGIPFIEGGWPGANPKDVQFFAHLQQYPLQQAEIVPFCSTRRPHSQASQETMLQAILTAGTRWVTIFGKSWDLHVIESLKTSLDENLAMISDTIEYLRSQGRRVIYDAEHWFDGYKQNPSYALQTLNTAVIAGAEWIVLCDTNGGTLPHEVSQIVKDVISYIAVISNIPGKKLPQVGIHTHNDAEMAVANAITGVISGANMVQGTINGYGERCGNANLCSVIPNLQLKLGYNCIGEHQLHQITETSRFVSEVVNLAHDEHAPFVGISAFAHKGGIHVSAVERNPLTYEHIKPEQVGNHRRIVISEQSGLSNVLAKAKSLGIELDKEHPQAREILQRIKALESEGYQFEAAEASFALLVYDALGCREKFFEVKGFQVHCDLVEGKEYTNSLATIKIAVNSENILEAAEGNGPVSALDNALRKALINFYPQIADFELTDYKVRILNGYTGTAAKTRALVESGTGQQRWTTIGVSTNILEASYQAVVQGLEYGLLLFSKIAH
ncbi:citramalate synthase [Anabaena sp. FACHB-1237]|uniref:citramalate synthase n=1 Tax=Anabaena sp. FACHB-1237 TaxID=2692769 RepID=UPI001680BBC2|nr:citramalate synthase [Anabaena sp. FACHB-1237]MBD2138297.1 citramalate synthase [Anabaena sp. FACHB-1237]